MSVISVYSVDNNKNKIIMTPLIFQTLLFVLALILVSLLAWWLGKSHSICKGNIVESVIDKVSSLLKSKMELDVEQYKAGPWYLVVYTQETPYPTWISNNNIRSVHPDAKNNKLIVKQFNGEDMVIENVDRYELSAANEMCDYDM